MSVVSDPDRVGGRTRLRFGINLVVFAGTTFDPFRVGSYAETDRGRCPPAIISVPYRDKHKATQFHYRICSSKTGWDALRETALNIS